MVESMRLPLARMPDRLPVPVLPHRRGSVAFDAVLRTPGSKSLTNRALLLAALSEGASVIRGGLTDGDDAAAMMQALRTLGARIEITREADGREAVRVEGVAGRWRVAGAVTLRAHNAGTAARFLAAAALLSPEAITIEGEIQLRQRPMGRLGAALERCGARVEYLGEAGCLPMRITPPATPVVPGVLDLGPAESSQFISALLMIGPWLDHGVTLRVSGPLTSASYVSMTLALLGRLGATVQHSENLRVLRVGPPRSTEPCEVPATQKRFEIQHGPARRGLGGFEIEIEPDASGATYFWAAAALTPEASCRALGLGPRSLQGDARFPVLLERMGAHLHVEDDESSIEVRGGAGLRPVLADMSEMPDAAPTLAVVAAFASGTSVLRGVRTLRVKECNRVEGLRRELAKIGVKVESPVHGDDDVMTITPPEGGIDTSPGAAGVEFETYNDHRMAMSLALVGLRRPNITIRDPVCVAKTYPGFWFDLASLYA